MSRKRRYGMIILAAAILIAAIIIGRNYAKLSLREQHIHTDLYSLVPTTCNTVLEINDLNALSKNIRQTYFFQEYKKLQISDPLMFLTNCFNQLSAGQAHGLSAGMNRLLVSFHEPGNAQDQIIYGQWTDTEKRAFEELMRQYSPASFSPKIRHHNGGEIAIYPVGKDFLACYFQPGFFAISPQKRLIEQVIDARRNEQAVNQDKALGALRRQRKHHEVLTLYVCDTPQKKWSELDIRMNESAIYLTGDSPAHADGAFPDSGISIRRLDISQLPGHIRMMCQRPFYHRTDNDSVQTDDGTLEGWLDKHGCREVSVILFAPRKDTTVTFQLLSFPSSATQITRMQRELHRNNRILTRYWIQGIPYPVWSYDGGDTLNEYFPCQPSVRDYCLTFYGDNILVATEPEVLREYVLEVTDPDNSQEEGNRGLYQYSLNDLAEQAGFTLIADMNDLMEEDMHPYADRLLPDFFLKYRDFFRRFMFSAQFIYADGRLSTNLILNYQGDSLILPQPYRHRSDERVEAEHD